MKYLTVLLRVMFIAMLAASCQGCDPQVYGSVGVSTGFGSYGGYRGGSNTRMHGSISVGGRIR